MGKVWYAVDEFSIEDGRSADWSQPSTSISQPIVIARPQQAWNNHMQLQNTYRNFSSKK